MKKIRNIVLALTLLLGVAGCQPKASLSDDIYIFYTSDVHCGIDENLGLAGLKAIVDDAKAEHPNVALVDLGDDIQGGSVGLLSRGEIIVRLMNKMGYDCMTVGNHEFDYGMDRLAELFDMIEFPILASNVKYTGSKTNIFEGRTIPYLIKDFEGTKVAFIGVLTPESLISSTPAFFQEDGKFVYDFYSADNGDELAAVVQENVDKVRAEGADYVVLMTHLGSVPENAPYDSISLIHKTNGVDVVLDGHAHSVIIGDPYPNKDGEDVILSSVGTKLENVGQLIIGKDGSISTVLISEYNRKDETIEAEVAAAFVELDGLLSEKVGNIAFDLTITDPDGHRIVRSRETNMADVVTDSYARKLGVEITVTNGGGVRATIPAGQVTVKELLDVLPFNNYLGICNATGQQILDCLEFGAKDTEGITVLEDNSVGEHGGFIQVSGIKYTIDSTIPSPVILDENGMMIDIIGPRRISDVSVLVNGTYVPIDPEAKYKVGGVSYVLFHNGDGNTAFKDAEVVEDQVCLDIDALREFFVESNGVPEIYAQTQGRITVK